MLVFEDLLPAPHNAIVLDLLFYLATWHAFASYGNLIGRFQGGNSCPQLCTLSICQQNMQSICHLRSSSGGSSTQSLSGCQSIGIRESGTASHYL
jgi:hypothetical protein